MKIFILFILALSVSYPQFNFRKLGGPEGGSFRVLYAAGDTVLINGNYKTFASSNGGDSWSGSRLDTAYRFENFVLADSVCLGASRDGLFRSINLIDWEIKTQGNYTDLAKDPYGNIYLFGNYHHLLRSTDKGDSFQEFWSVLNPFFASIFTNEKYIFITGKKLIHRRRIDIPDSMAQWDQIPFPDFNNQIKMSRDESGMLYSISYAKQILSYSDDKGDTWKFINIGVSYPEIHPTEICGGGGIILMVSDTYQLGDNGDRLYRSTDRGLTWNIIKDLPPGLPMYDIRYSGSDFYMSVGALGVFKSSDLGMTWNAVNNGLREMSLSNLVIMSDGTLFTSGWGTGIYKSTDQGDSWQPFNDGIIDYRMEALIKNQKDELFADGLKYIYKFSYGNTESKWELTGFPPGALGIDSRDRLFLRYGDIKISDDEGKTWRTVFSEYNPTDMALTRSGKIIVSTLNPKKLYISLNDGGNWVHVYTHSDYLGHPFIDSNDNIFFTSGNGIIKSTNDGQSWNAISSGFTNLKTSKVFSDNKGNYFCATLFHWTEGWVYPELYHSTDEGENWVDITGNLFMTNVYGIQFLRKRTLLATSRGIWMVEEEDISGTEGIENISFSLKQNYPNPFNPVTIIEFSLPSAEYVTLKIYDILGSEVETLIDNDYMPGSHSIEFNAAGLSSGVYIYKLTAGQYRGINKMQVIK